MMSLVTEAGFTLVHCVMTAAHVCVCVCAYVVLSCIFSLDPIDFY